MMDIAITTDLEEVGSYLLDRFIADYEQLGLDPPIALKGSFEVKHAGVRVALRNPPLTSHCRLSTPPVFPIELITPAS